MRRKLKGKKNPKTSGNRSAPLEGKYKPCSWQNKPLKFFFNVGKREKRFFVRHRKEALNFILVVLLEQLIEPCLRSFNHTKSSEQLEVIQSLDCVLLKWHFVACFRDEIEVAVVDEQMFSFLFGRGLGDHTSPRIHQHALAPRPARFAVLSGLCRCCHKTLSIKGPRHKERAPVSRAGGHSESRGSDDDCGAHPCQASEESGKTKIIADGEADRVAAQRDERGGSRAGSYARRLAQRTVVKEMHFAIASTKKPRRARKPQNRVKGTRVLLLVRVVVSLHVVSLHACVVVVVSLHVMLDVVALVLLVVFVVLNDAQTHVDAMAHSGLTHPRQLRDAHRTSVRTSETCC